MQENTIYFALKSNLRHRMDIDLKRNSMRNDDRFVFNLIIIMKKKGDNFRHLSQFWRQVSPKYILQLGEDWAYGMDLKVFDYSLERYFQDIGMSDHLDKYK